MDTRELDYIDQDFGAETRLTAQQHYGPNKPVVGVLDQFILRTLNFLSFHDFRQKYTLRLVEIKDQTSVVAIGGSQLRTGYFYFCPKKEHLEKLDEEKLRKLGLIKQSKFPNQLAIKYHEDAHQRVLFKVKEGVAFSFADFQSLMTDVFGKGSTNYIQKAFDYHSGQAPDLVFKKYEITGQGSIEPVMMINVKQLCGGELRGQYAHDKWKKALTKK